MTKRGLIIMDDPEGEEFTKNVRERMSRLSRSIEKHFILSEEHLPKGGERVTATQIRMQERGDKWESH